MQEDTKGNFNILSFTGLGLWNVYFIAKFALAHYEYLTLNFLYNGLLLLFILLPLKNRFLCIARTVVALIAAVALLYSESWLPGPDSIISNAQNIAGFSAMYVAQLIVDFVNVKMVIWGIVIVLAYLLIKNWVRLTVFTLGYFICLVLQPYYVAWTTKPAVEQNVEVVAQNKPSQPQQETNADPSAITSETIDKWYTAFLDYEKGRRAEFPQGLSANDTPFEIILMNICSLSNDDLLASDLMNHPVLSEFNIRFDHFNSATSYSGPATLRLLNAVCGQVNHDSLYDGRRPECEIMNRLDQLGYRQHLYLDHRGQYDNYLQTLRDKAGLMAPLESTAKYPVRYMAFDDEEIADDLAVLRDWQRKTSRDKETKRHVTLFNFIALHDGNRLPRHSRWEEFKPRAIRFLNDLQTFMHELERSGRKVMLIVVPEHGAAVRGDRIQAPRLRDIPSMRITEVPLMVKFFGIKNMPAEPIHVTGPTSYLAMSTLIGRVLSLNYFGADGGSVPLEELVRDLPETNPVSENGQSVVLTYRGNDYIRQKGGEWRPYPRER
ncbi:cellulose biosynthesis protein BcsG [Parasutterella secunda]|uniref:Cellulose biosynthesis protein BcsG n=1 Tax=Parasutterella secunda TaxID=626947 RepID=A0ABS2GSK5_9BURK|nr:cellulose biosynthesis protein BcsG [Parasutterella secunda]MBM6927932.1 cellulose biosynthesis protein BcsG [Parasutterella secunda]